LIEETTMTAIDERSFVQCDPVVGDVLRFEDHIVVVPRECSKKPYDETLCRVVLARVVGVLDVLLERSDPMYGLVPLDAGAYIMEVVESTGPEELAVGTTVCRTVSMLQYGGHLRLPWADESKRPNETNDN
jgi:hypothetical protein